ncbi:hypothetical protein MTP99_006692 [Tenebrio molitor]|uniref:Uncharacterized protein n=1 Tax=Tenebrio molitor TaxID=7067 RepID=A0A8J6HRQ3_TENMO|nr:hypothetical protein GEV33_004358 [Tenebrio molitor]KAJ3618726.1 hypothetical protein MTP99_006692 [Tenebrio molitor]
MSSTVSTTEVQTISKKVMTPRKADDKTQRLVRTSSLEKIRRFNSFICSQQYYVLPALLAWLKSSQTVLQSSTEKTIFFFRSLLFTHFLYKLCQLEFRTIVSNGLLLVRKQFREICLLKWAVYATALVLSAQLFLCFYLLCNTHVPNGLAFLIVCWFYIIYLNASSVCFVPKRSNNVIKKTN